MVAQERGDRGARGGGGGLGGQSQSLTLRVGCPWAGEGPGWAGGWSKAMTRNTRAGEECGPICFGCLGTGQISLVEHKYICFHT